MSSSTSKDGIRISVSWEDSFLSDEQLTEEERLMRDSTKARCEDRLMPRGHAKLSAWIPATGQVCMLNLEAVNTYEKALTTSTLYLGSLSDQLAGAHGLVTLDRADFSQCPETRAPLP